MLQTLAIPNTPSSGLFEKHTTSNLILSAGRKRVQVVTDPLMHTELTEKARMPTSLIPPAQQLVVESPTPHASRAPDPNHAASCQLPASTIRCDDRVAGRRRRQPGIAMLFGYRPHQPCHLIQKAERVLGFSRLNCRSWPWCSNAAVLHACQLETGGICSNGDCADSCGQCSLPYCLVSIEKVTALSSRFNLGI